MEYMIVNYSEPHTDAPAPGEPGFEEMMGRWMAFNQHLIDNGHWVGGASLAGPESATTVAKTPEQISITDGPYIETKEVIGGFYLVKADNLDEAIELAKMIPIDNGHLEVWPVAFRPDAD